MTKEDLGNELKSIATLRKTGDALLKIGKRDPALATWSQAEKKTGPLLLSLSHIDSAEDRAELYGVRGGILKRLGQESDALVCYEQGAIEESNAGLSSTYNRLNAIRSALLCGSLTIDGASSRLREVRGLLEDQLKKPASASSGWLWADLGDVCTLLGDSENAEVNYRPYVAKAGGEEVRITREALEQLRARLTERGDPDVNRITAGLEALSRAPGDKRPGSP
jgi:tetratricopeptide (TPR) repeat protein